MLNVIWTFFFLASFLAASYQAFIIGNTQIWSICINALFDAAKNAFTISINLTGMLCLWLGLLKIAESSGLTALLAKGLKPLFRKILPDIPENHPSIGSIATNLAANMLGLDNAATPIGLKAMEQLQEVNLDKETASNAQILFMVLNASAVTVVPINILIYRAQFGSANPCAVFIPILLATSISTLTGFLAVSISQKLNILNKTVMTYLGGFLLFIGTIATYFCSLPDNLRLTYSECAGNFLLFFIVVLFITSGIIRRINAYDVFIQGAKEGFDIAVKIIPYLVSMLAAIAVFRASGLTDMLIECIEQILGVININTDFSPALTTAFLKPLSGSGARAMMVETIQVYGADSFPAFVSSVIQGSTETTFYVLAVYFGAVKISKTRSALPCSLLADFAGIVSAIVLSYVFF